MLVTKGPATLVSLLGLAVALFFCNGGQVRCLGCGAGRVGEWTRAVWFRFLGNVNGANLVRALFAGHRFAGRYDRRQRATFLLGAKVNLLQSANLDHLSATLSRCVGCADAEVAGRAFRAIGRTKSFHVDARDGRRVGARLNADDSWLGAHAGLRSCLDLRLSAVDGRSNAGARGVRSSIRRRRKARVSRVAQVARHKEVLGASGCFTMADGDGRDGGNQDVWRSRGRAVGDAGNVRNLNDIGCAGQNSRGDRVYRVRRGSAAKARLVALLNTPRGDAVRFVYGGVVVVEAAGALGLDEEPPDKVGDDGNDDDAADDTACYRTSAGTVVAFAAAVVAAAIATVAIGPGGLAESFRALGATLRRISTILPARTCRANELLVSIAADAVLLTDEEFRGCRAS